MARILVVDNETNILIILNALLKNEGYDVVCESDCTKVAPLIKTQDFDLMIADIRMSPVSGMELLTLARREKPGMQVIMLTAFASVETAVQAMNVGAYDYVSKPFKAEDLVATVRRALEVGKGGGPVAPSGRNG